MQTTGWELVEPIGQYERLTKEQASAAIEELILEGYNPNLMRAIPDGTV